MTGPIRLFSVLGRDRHTMIGYAGQGVSAVADLTAAAAAAVEGAHGEMDAYLIAAPGAGTGRTLAGGCTMATGSSPRPTTRPRARSSWCDPDGYLGYRGDAADVDALTRYLKATFS